MSRMTLSSATALVVVMVAASVAPAKEKVLFDFEDGAELKHWSNLQVEIPKGVRRTGLYGDKDHPVKIEL